MADSRSLSAKGVDVSLTYRRQGCPILGFIVVICCLPGTADAGPFGLDMGMSKAQAGVSLDAEDMGGHRFKITKVPRPHSAFEAYVLRITPTHGLCYLEAIGKAIDTSVDGERLRDQFNELAAALENRYGQHKRQDFLRAGSILDEPRDWMSGLANKERVLAIRFDKEEGSTLSYGVTSAFLSAAALSRTKGYLNLEYSFGNYEACKTEADSDEDSVQ